MKYEATLRKIENVNKAITWFDGKAFEMVKTGAVKITLQHESELEEEKSDVQREKFHAMFGDIQKTGVIVMPGRKVAMNQYTPEKVKALLVLWFVNEKKDLGETIPNPPEHFMCPVTGESITIRPSTKKWGKKLTSEFIEYIYATGTMIGTRWSEPALKEYEEYRQANK